VSSRDSKNTKFFNYINQNDYDAYAMAEVGLYWTSLFSEDQWADRTVTSFLAERSVFGYNCKEPPTDRQGKQYGGTGIMCVNESAHRVTHRGIGSSGLGRWSWIQLQGKDGISVRFISAYRPVLSNETGPVYQQHKRHFRLKQTGREPRAAFFEDLFESIKEWLSLGDQIILGMDANEDRANR
jgi:hypothetical protein